MMIDDDFPPFFKEDVLPLELGSNMPNRKTNNSPVNDQPPPPYKSLTELETTGMISHSINIIIRAVCLKICVK